HHDDEHMIQPRHRIVIVVPIVGRSGADARDDGRETNGGDGLLHLIASSRGRGSSRPSGNLWGSGDKPVNGPPYPCEETANSAYGETAAWLTTEHSPRSARAPSFGWSDHHERRQLHAATVRQIHRAVPGHDAIARAVLRGHLRDGRQSAGGV